MKCHGPASLVIYHLDDFNHFVPNLVVFHATIVEANGILTCFNGDFPWGNGDFTKHFWSFLTGHKKI